jgi:hypothetical protein
MSKNMFNEKKNLLVSMVSKKLGSSGEVGYSTLNTTTVAYNRPLGALNTSSRLENTLLANANDLNTAEYDSRKASYRNVHGRGGSSSSYQHQVNVDDNVVDEGIYTL